MKPRWQSIADAYKAQLPESLDLKMIQDSSKAKQRYQEEEHEKEELSIRIEDHSAYDQEGLLIIEEN